MRKLMDACCRLVLGMARARQARQRTVIQRAIGNSIRRRQRVG